MSNAAKNGRVTTITAVDVDYRGNMAVAAGVRFADWGAREPLDEKTAVIRPVAAYQPGQFYKRELPCLLAVLAEWPHPPTCVVVDGYVYLDADGRPGLGHYLYEALHGRCAVVGVAKSRFREIPSETAVRRGNSRRPLYVTAVGMEAAVARRAVTEMYGPYRIPALLKRVDRLCRTTDIPS